MAQAEHNVKDYDEEYKNFKWSVPMDFNFAWDAVEKWADDRTKLAMISVDHMGENPQYHSFWDLKVLSNKFANVLKEMGLKKGDRVFLMLPRIPEWYVAILGMMKLGVVFMLTPTLSTPKDIMYRINKAEAVMVITSTEFASRVEEVGGLAPKYSPGEALVKELQDYVKKTIAPYKYPREIELVTELPKTINGKIKRVELRKMETEKRRG